MATTITEITECFEYFFSSLYRREFVKTLRLNECSERGLLPLVRCYLLGWFADNVSPEVKSKLPGTVSGHGYIYFVIDDVAVEFAVRKPTAARSQCLRDRQQCRSKEIDEARRQSLACAV